MHSSIICIVTYATKKIYAYTSLYDFCLTRIIHIVNLTHKFVALPYNRVWEMIIYKFSEGLMDILLLCLKFLLLVLRQ